MANVKEHATLSARASVDHGVGVGVKKRHVNRAADRGCVSRLVLLLVFTSSWGIAIRAIFLAHGGRMSRWKLESLQGMAG